MAAGDLTMSTAVHCEGIAAVKTAVDAINLAATTDFIFVLNGERDNAFYVFKIERAAA